MREKWQHIVNYKMIPVIAMLINKTMILGSAKGGKLKSLSRINPDSKAYRDRLIAGSLHNILPKLVLGCMLIFSNASLAINNALKLTISNTTYSDETIVRYVDGATADFDASYDAWKIFSSNPAVPQIYTMIASGSALSINAFPALIKNEDVKVYAGVGSIGTYTITATEVGAFASDITIFIENTATGDIHDLRVNPVYTFSVSDVAAFNSNKGKFIIHFSVPPVIVSDFVINTDTLVPLNTMVNFINLSQNASSYLWDFGDGSPLSTARDPSHTYSVLGDFPVKLIAQAATFSDTTVKMMYVNLTTQLNNPIKENNCKLFYHDNILTIDFNNTVQRSVALSINTVEGREVARGKLFDISKITLPVNEQKSVVYIVNMQTDEAVFSRKIVIDAGRD